MFLLPWSHPACERIQSRSHWWAAQAQMVLTEGVVWGLSLLATADPCGRGCAFWPLGTGWLFP